MSAGPKSEQDSGTETLENYIDGIFSGTLTADPLDHNDDDDKKIARTTQNKIIDDNDDNKIDNDEMDDDDDEKLVVGTVPGAVELKRQNSSSSVSSSGSSSTYSIEISRTSPLISFSSSAKKTRNKWKASEDFALLGMLLNYSHLLTFVEYFKPMKKFWIKISQALNEQYGFERNARQCHDRFKVLYSKALRIQDDIDEDDTYSGTLNSESKQLLLQVRNTFTFCNGNITLKSQPTVAGTAAAVSATTANATTANANANTVNADPADLRQPQQQQQQQQHDETTETERKERETMHSYIFHVLSNLQEQIDLLRSHLRATDRKTQELATTLQDLISAVQYPLPQPSSFANSNANRSENHDEDSQRHLHQRPR